MNPGTPGEEQFRLTQGTVTIGRTKDNAVFCLHKSLSRRHAQIDFDGVKLRVTDLQSKNGIFVNGKRVRQAELLHGDSFRCGDITFLIEAATTQSPGLGGRGRASDGPAQTLQSPFGPEPTVVVPTGLAEPQPQSAGDPRYKDKLFLLIRASELCVSELPIDRILEELVELAVQVLEVDRIALLTLDDATLQMRPVAGRSFTSSAAIPYSARVVNWVVNQGNPASFADVSRDRSLPGDLAYDANVRGAMCVPINPGGGTIGVIYADSLSRTDCFRPEDLALLRGLANLAAVSIESAVLRDGKG